MIINLLIDRLRKLNHLPRWQEALRPDPISPKPGRRTEEQTLAIRPLCRIRRLPARAGLQSGICRAPAAVQQHDNKVAAQSEIHYVSDTQFLVLARDSNAGHGQTDSESLYCHADVLRSTSLTRRTSRSPWATTHSTDRLRRPTTGTLHAGIHGAGTDIRTSAASDTRTRQVTYSLDNQAFVFKVKLPGGIPWVYLFYSTSLSEMYLGRRAELPNLLFTLRELRAS
ncbi:hypothetical protein T310_3658 [Rasamsonia emersonii CBS 393.64]|uniref:Uncharacterized protein n=1 Tax=Rasamsonia emersonii (strain ATCC 16479 / CBS 393.64 / IMI 116815) TaxID=1408163 RepID=A0A0F4YXI8_RASE3|nr:hypothetical protein T310_3658 [Rasamsonia emersonii CBS 393.64]KKA22328.1 hypothetical protein T310_3658 [Rasamsonia emersonii CBS 393.64]